MATTTIRQRQIEDGAINDAKVAAGAAIASTKLADGANFIKKDGSVAMTGELAMGNQKITGLGTPSATTDAATKSYVDTLIANLNSLFDNKPSVRAATTANITLSGAQTIDGVSVVATDRVLVKNQTAPAENGIYVAAAGAWSRALDMDAWAEIPGSVTVVEEGTTLADTFWFVTSNAGGTLDTTAISWTQINISGGGGGLAISNFVDNEVPAGTINGSNVTFTFANTPTAGTEHLYLNGQRIFVGAGNDYTISGATITMLAAPLTGERLIGDYKKS